MASSLRHSFTCVAGKQENSPRKHFHYFGGARPGSPANYRGVRDARWKLLTRTDKNGAAHPRELYDLGNDPSEKFNRLEQHPEIVKRLMAEVRSLRAEFKDHRRPHGQITR